MSAEYSQKFLFLPRGNYAPREPKLALERGQVLKAIQWLKGTSPKGAVHYDLETVGLQYEDSNRLITTIGIACEEWLIGLNLAVLTVEEQEPIWEWLGKQTVGGFNLAFDASWPWGGEIKDLDISMDTAVMFRALATDAGKGIRLNLETLIEDCLGWEDHQKNWLSSALTEHRIGKDDMYKLSVLEPEGFTKYCAWDAEASLQAEHYFRSRIEALNFPVLHTWIPIWNNKLKRIVRSTHKGIHIDREKALRNIQWVNTRMLTLESKLLSHPELAPHFQAWETKQLHKNYQLKVGVKKKWAKKDETPWMFPERYQLELAEDPDKLPAWLKPYGGKFFEVEPTFNLKGKTKPYPRFNFRSPDVMKWLLYECLLQKQYEITYTHKDGEKPRGYVTFKREGRTYEVDLTIPGCALPTGGDVLKPFGEVGAMMDEYKELQKLSEEFLWKYYEASKETGRIHPGLMIHGTQTGRCSGGSSKKTSKVGGHKKQKVKLSEDVWKRALEGDHSEDS